MLEKVKDYLIIQIYQWKKKIAKTVTQILIILEFTISYIK